MRHHLIKVTYETRTCIIDIVCIPLLSFLKSSLTGEQCHGIYIELY